MNEILELLKEALNRMILKTDEARVLVEDTKTLKAQAEAQLASIRVKVQEIEANIADLQAREQKIGNAEAVIAREAKLSADVDAFLNERARVEALMKEKEKKLVELEGQLLLRKDKLAEQSSALEKEKVEYQARIRDEIVKQITGQAQ